MPNYKLTSFSLCPYVQRALIVLAEKNVPYERVDIDLANKPDWFLELSPLGKVPVLEADENVLFESQVIAEYLDEVTEGSLHPSDPLQKARHRAWIEFGSQALATLFGFYTADNKEAFDAKRSDIVGKLARVADQVEGPFFAGEEFHLVDAVWGTVFRYIQTFEEVSDVDFYEGNEKLRTWHNAVLARKSVIDAAPQDYAEQLLAFVRKRESHLATLIQTKVAA